MKDRLISANKLQQHFTDMQHYESCAGNFLDNRGEPSTNWLYVEMALENASTVEDIPLDWLTEHEYGEDEELSIAANTVIKAWLMAKR